MKAKELFERGNGIEYWTVHNMAGQPKKFKKIDGFWEHPVEVRKWIASHERPMTAYDRDVARDRRQAEKEVRDAERAERAAEREKKKNRPSTQDIWHHIEDAIGNSFPDGDPIDYIGPWMNKNGLTMDDLDKATRIHAKAKSFNDYLADMWDDRSRDALHDAKQGHYGETYGNEWFTNSNPWRSS